MESELHTAFSCFDRNGDGSISTKELKYIVMTLGESLTDEEADYMIQHVDQDGDGHISYKEFVEMMMAKIKVT